MRRRGSRVWARASPRSVRHGWTRRRPWGARPRRGRRRSRAPRRPRRRAAQDRLGSAPHPLPGREQARPVRARAGRPRLQRRARALRVGRQVDARPVREPVARHGLHGQQLELLRERRARVGEQRVEDPRHGEQRRAGVPGEAVARHARALAAGRRAGLEHPHAVAQRGEPDRRREAAHARPDDGDPHRRSRRRSAGTAKAPIAAAPAAATRGRRHSAAFATVSPTHVHV